MEMASYLAGERWSDHPRCTHPLLASVARLVNDLTCEPNRSRLVELIPSVIGLTTHDPRADVRIALHCARRRRCRSRPVNAERPRRVGAHRRPDAGHPAGTSEPVASVPRASGRWTAPRTRPGGPADLRAVLTCRCPGSASSARDHRSPRRAGHRRGVCARSRSAPVRVAGHRDRRLRCGVRPDDRPGSTCGHRPPRVSLSPLSSNRRATAGETLPTRKRRPIGCLGLQDEEALQP